MKIPKEEERQTSQCGILENLFIVNVVTVEKSSGVLLCFLHLLIHFKGAYYG